MGCLYSGCFNKVVPTGFADGWLRWELWLKKVLAGLVRIKQSK